MKKLLLVSLLALTGCALDMPVLPEPVYLEPNAALEKEYQRYEKAGTASISGQAFMRQRGGTVIKAAGNEVTLDPADTTIAKDWWGKAGGSFYYQYSTPPSPAFRKHRLTVLADADGKFKFTNLPAGAYFVRTKVTWEVPAAGTQGGLVGQLVEAKEGKEINVILTSFNRTIDAN